MAKQIIQRYLPHPDRIREHKHLRGIFGRLLHEQNLWHLNRASVSGAFAVGLFMMWVPVPFQMILATGAAILLRTNLPISVALVWITNPLTIPPFFFFAYLVGTWILGTPQNEVEFSLTYAWLESVLPLIWEPLLLGCLINGVIGALIGYYGMRLFWNLHIIHRWKLRKQQRTQKS